MKTGILVLLLLFSLLPASGQSDTTGISRADKINFSDNFALFGSHDLLTMTIRFDITSFIRKKNKGLYLDGDLTIYSGKGDSITKNVRIKNRGIFRLQYCTFSPMEIYFKKPMYAYGDSGAIKKIKLGTQCQQSDMFGDYVLKEYLAYRIFNLFTDTSFRVRLVKVNYIDSGRARKPLQQYGFFIEPVTVMAERINSEVLKNITITQKSVMPHLMLRLAIFNYMIGNYDWAVPNQHNVAILKTNDPLADHMAIAIPHDFDWSGLVNPVYAVPTDDVGIESVRERLYTGICVNRESFRAELLKFLPLKQKIYSLINNFPYLDPKAKRDMIAYLDEFYCQLENQKLLESLIDKLESVCKHL